MKLLITLGLVALALAASHESNRREFEHGKEYEFEWKGQVASGLAIQGSSQHSIQQIHSRVLLTVNRDSTFWLRIAEPRMINGQRQIAEPRLFKQLSLDETELTSEQKQVLALPLRFRFHNGILSEIQFAEKDQAWSENIKRAVLNMLQVNLSTEKKSEYTNQRYYTSQEKTLEGECEVAYTINTDMKKEELEVTKSINFDKCTKRVDTRYNYRFSEECPECETSEDRLPESQTVINYKLSGSVERFLVKEVELKSEYVFAPLNKEQKMLSTYVHNKLTLVKVTDAERIEEPRLSEKSSLTYNYESEMARETFWMTGDDKEWKKAGFDKTPKVELVEKHIRQLVKLMESEKTGIEIQSTHEMSRIVDVLRMCSRKEIHHIHQTVCESDKYDEKTMDIVRDIMADALAIAGTKVTVEHIVEKINNKQIGVLKASQVMKTLVNIRTPSVEIVEVLLRLSKSEIVKRNPILRQSSLLTIGSLMNGVCGNNKDKMLYELEEVVKCTRQQKTEWVDLLKRMFEESESRYEKVLSLKTLANAGIDVSIHMLEDIIYDRKQDKMIRTQAIDALRQLRTQMPRKIQQILMPLYKSRQEQPEIRMSAVYHIVHTLPERVVIDQIVEQMNKERNQQVLSFTHSLLKSFIQSENPCERKFSQNVEVSLRMLLKKTDLSSRHFHLPLYNKISELGASFDIASIFSNETVLPKELLASLDTLFAGQWNKNLAQVGFSQQNLDNIILRILNNLESSEQLEEVVVRGRRASAQKPVHMLRELVKKLNIESRRSNDEESYAMIYLRYKNFDYAVLPFDEETINYITKNLFLNGKMDISEIERVLAKGLRFNTQAAAFFLENTRTIVTSSGMPLKVHNKLPTVFSVEGHIKAELEPRQSRSMHGVQIRLVALPTVASTLVSEMELVTPFVHSGIRMTHSLQFNLPIDTVFQFNWNKLQLKTIVKTPEIEKRVFLFETRPVSFIRRAQGGRYETEEKTVYVNQLDKTNVHYEKSYGQEIFGLEMNVFGSVHRHMFDKKSPEAILIGENHIEVRIVPTEKRVREFVLEVESTNNKEHSLESPRYDEIFASDSFSSDESEENQYTRRSEERTEVSRKYYENLKVDKSYNNRLVAKIYTVGGPQELKGDVEIRSSCEENFRFCKLNLNAKRSPLFEESRVWELKAKIETILPQIPSTLKQLTEQKHREVQATVECEWGCEEKNTLKVKLQGEQDREMERIVREMIHEKKTSGLTQYNMLRQAAQLNQYKLVAQYDLLPKNEKMMKQMYDLFQAYYYISADVTPLNLKKDHIRVLFTVEPETRRFANLTIETPEQRLQIREIDTYIRLPLINIAQSTEINEIRKVAQVSECEIKSNKINSFDNLIYKAPLTTCYSVLAKDCSEEPQFAVLMKKLSKNGEEKKVKIISEENVMEIELIDEQVVCKVNGKEIRDEDRLREFGIKLLNEQLCEIELEHLTVRFDGYTAQIKMSHRMQNKQCGLCGHFDGQSDNEFRRADNKQTEDIEEFHRSWLARDSECEIEESRLSEKKNYRILETEEREEYYNTEDRYESRDEETVEPKMKTLVLERHSETCFSVEAVPMCESAELIASSEKKKVTFTCLPKHDRITRKLVSQIRRESVVDIENQEENIIVERIQLPKMCRAY